MTWQRFRHKPPHHTCDWVKIDVHIVRTSDGLERVMHTDGVLDDDDKTLHTWIWEEGNYSCDYNRHIFFERAADREADDDEDHQCDRGRYIVWIVNPANGAIVYDERPT